MTLLHSITLGNVRRFAPDVRIGLGPGATILLAPNGTGKTAIFEAIELALTGSVSRLSNNLAPLIRDGKAECEVRLDFGDVIRKVTLSKGAKPKLEGDLDEVLRGLDPQDLTYLLRLTHLLDQREGGWFVQAGSEAAGGQLARLPIGRDGAQASAVLTGAKRAATEKNKEAERRLAEARERLASWVRLLNERNKAPSDLVRPLEALEVLLSRVRSLTTQSCEDKEPAETNHPTVTNFWAEVSSMVDSRKESNMTRAGALAVADEVVEEFNAAKNEFALSQESNNLAKISRKSAEDSLAAAQEAFESQEAIRSEHEVTLQGILELLRQIELLSNLRAQLIAKEDMLTQASEAVVVAEKVLMDNHEKSGVAKKLEEAHRDLRSRSASLEVAEAELEDARKKLRELIGNLLELQALDTVLSAMALEYEALNKVYQEAARVLADREHEAAEAQSNFDSLSSASGAIREAVGIIATQLPKDREDCPVCGQNHGASELHHRISHSLHAMDPALGLASERAKLASEAVNAASEELKIASVPVSVVYVRLAEGRAKRETLCSAISEASEQPLLCSGDVENANLALASRASELESARRSLQAEQVALPIEPYADLLATLVSDVRSAEKELEIARTRLAEARVSRDLAKEYLESTENGIGETGSVDAIILRRTDIDTVLASAKVAVERVREERDRMREALDVADEAIRRTEVLANTASDRLRGIRSRWLAIPLSGEPSTDTASAAKSTLEGDQLKSDSDRAELDLIRAELARWETAETNNRTQREVDEIRGEFAEDGYSVKLALEVKSAEAVVNRVTIGSNALDTITSCLSHELDNIHDRIRAVVPQWCALLNRIVREPRFSATNLASYSHYRKHHAEVKVPLHGGHTLVSDVASEAQMTDLQLTFLLAMAQGHCWSPWRALLLDDPTQHHDLVHASAVFDVLRDYISDHGFQVLIATHDALQARFFMRKLENDGLPARLWTLTPTAEGVQAVLGA